MYKLFLTIGEASDGQGYFYRFLGVTSFPPWNYHFLPLALTNGKENNVSGTSWGQKDVRTLPS